MGCFFGCFRSKDKERPCGVHLSTTTTTAPPKSREHLIANNRSQAGRFHGSGQEIGGSSPFLDALSDCTDQRKAENLCLRSGNIKWAQQLIAPAEDFVVQKAADSPKSQSPQLITVHTPLSNSTRARNFSEEDETKKFNDEVKYLKSCGTLLRTPSEIREASERDRVSSEDEKNLGSDWHSWFPPPHPVAEISKVDWDGKPNQVPTPPAHLHEELCKIPTPNLSLHVPNQLSTRFVNGKQDALHLEGKEGEDEGVHSICASGLSSAVTEDEQIPTIATPNSSKTLVPTVERPPRLKQYNEIAEEESDSFSDTGSFASLDSAVRNENQRSKVFDSPARDEPQTPLLFKSNYPPQPAPSKGEPQTPSLFKSNYSPQHTTSSYEPQTPPLFISHYSPHPTPLKLTNDMHTPWLGGPKVLENAGVNKNARFRSQYVYSVLNPVENLSQWKALKKGDSKENVEEKNHPWGEESVENQSVIALQAQITPTSTQRNESRGAVTGSGIPKVPCYSASRVDYRAKENFPSEEERKFTEEYLDMIDESGQKRKLIVASPEEPFFKLSKSSGQCNLITEQSQLPGAVHVDSSLSHWVKPTATVEESKAGWFPLMRDVLGSDAYQHHTSVETQNSGVAMLDKSLPSTSSLEVLQMQSSKSSKNMDDRPVLGVLSTCHRQSVSPGRSPSNKSGDDDRPILGTVAAHWNDNQGASPKWWDGKGIPNSTNKYKEDQKVSWHSTPFEERLEKALSNEGVVSQRKLFNGKPIEFVESEESDTAASCTSRT